MKCSRTNPIQLNITIGNTHFEQVQQFSYLGSKITKDGRGKALFLCRKAQAKQAFQNKNHLLTTNSVTSQTTKKLLKIYVWSNTLYGCETWTINKIERSKLKAFEMLCFEK